jgi:hypothetical protein
VGGDAARRRRLSLGARKRTDEALGVNAAMVGTSVALVASTAKTDRPAALAVLPLERDDISWKRIRSF